MKQDWAKSAAGRRILIHWMDTRPAWLWSGDGARLIWRNPASLLFGAKQKKSGLRLAPNPVPIKGQVARLVRLGSPGRSSLSRIQFLAGGRPESTTCTVTPLEGPDRETVLLIVGVDPIEADMLDAAGRQEEPLAEALLPEGADFVLIDEDGQAAGGSLAGTGHYAPLLRDGRIALPEETATAEIDGESLTLTRLKAGPGGEQLLIIEGGARGESIADIRAEEGLGVLERAPASDGDEPPLPMGLEPLPPRTEPAGGSEPVDEVPAEPRQSLTSLFDRLAENEALYDELPEADEQPDPPPEAADTDDVAATPAGEAPRAVEEPEGPRPPAVETSAVETSEEPAADETPEADADAPATGSSPEGPDVIAAVIEFEDDLSDEPVRASTYRVVGRGFTPIGEVDPNLADADIPDDEAAADALIEQASRYNFDELSRILADRVGNGAIDEQAEAAETEAAEAELPPAPPPTAPGDGALVSIAGETFILNRLPIGIMVFRDQQVLFANRALTDLVGYETVDALRAAGMAAIFPSDDAASAGPVTHLLRRDGASMPVTARLQSISWQGRPALMLSASAAEMRIGHEAAVRAFAESIADLQEDGFLEADRAGTIRAINAAARTAIGRADDDVTGSPLASHVHADDVPVLQEFLERPARFAETARPSVRLRGTKPATELLLFAEGQAGIVTGYFGFARERPAERVTPATTAEDADPSMLVRISRGVRRPLNTVIGFADLIRSSSFGTAENHRYLEYARDIKTAGQEIAVLVDELDEFARLKAGKYAPRPAELDLESLLESCVVRVRGQAGAARVLVRSAISERLPHIRADRSSLGQAVLNLLASAIDQSPAGGSVILSAQPEEDGSVVVNIRDSSAAGTDLGERFVVFRDGVSKDGEALAPVRSSVGLALTRALVAVNACRLSVDPAGATGTLFSVTIPPDLVARLQAI